MKKIGVIGHRFFAGKDIETFVEDQCRSILRQYKDQNRCSAALSAIAEGADSIFAREALALDMPLEVVRPFYDYEDDFQSDGSIALYNRLRSLASAETILPYKKRATDAYYDAMQWVISHSELLVIIWDGNLTTQYRGGTADSIKYLSKRKWIHIDVANQCTHFFNHNSRTSRS